MASALFGRFLLFLEADKLFLRCNQREVGNKQLNCFATNFSTYSAAIIVYKYNRMLERIGVQTPNVVFRASDLTYNVDYTIKFGTGEQKICLFGMFARRNVITKKLLSQYQNKNNARKVRCTRVSIIPHRHESKLNSRYKHFHNQWLHVR